MRILATLTAMAFGGGALAEVPRVVADIAPVHSLAARVMQGVGAPELAIPPGASPHGYAMRPSEARALGGADLVIWIGPGLTPWLERPLATLAGGAAQLALMEVPGTQLLEFRTGAGFEAHDHADDHAGEHAHGAEVEMAVDPHGWLDPRNGALWLGAIAGALAERDPENAALYRANAAAGQAELAALEARIAARLAPLRGRPFIVFHDAYHYFEARFGVEAVAAISLGDASAPGAARLSEVRDVLRQTGAACAFVEPQFNPGLIEAVTEGTPVKTVELDPIGVSFDLGPELYAAVLMQIADAQAACLAR